MRGPARHGYAGAARVTTEKGKEGPTVDGASARGIQHVSSHPTIDKAKIVIYSTARVPIKRKRNERVPRSGQTSAWKKGVPLSKGPQMKRRLGTSTRVIPDFPNRTRELDRNQQTLTGQEQKKGR